MLVVIAIAVVAVVVLAALAWGRRRAPDDGVANFQRQIDALSRDARKPTIEQLRHTDEDQPDQHDQDQEDAAASDSEGDDDGS